MLTKYLIFLLTPLSIVYLTFLFTKNKGNKLLLIVIIIAAIIILVSSTLLLIKLYTPVHSIIVPSNIW